MKIRKVLALFCSIVLAIVFIAGCSAQQEKGDPQKSDSSVTETEKAPEETQEENKFDKRIKITTAGVALVEGMDYNNCDPMMQLIQDKFNFDIEIIAMSWDTWPEKNRVWINSGDMPDYTFWDFNYADYKNYVEQGLIKALPDDYETKYPTLAKVIQKSGVAEPLKERFDGKLYMVPKTIFFNAPTEKNVPHISLYYRKDWAEKLGFEIGTLVTQNEVIELARAFKEKDPGGVGTGNAMGLGIGMNMLPEFFIGPYNPSASHDEFIHTFHKVDGEYVWAPAEESTLEGLKLYKKCYDEGLIDPDFFTKTQLAELDEFYAGKNGMFLVCGTSACAQQYFDTFRNNNPDTNPVEIIGLAAVTDNDGKYHCVEAGNFWCASVFNPDLDEEKFDRILSIMDWTCTDEGQNLIRMGFEGKDYKVEDGKIIITREKDENGQFKGMREIYPSYDFWWTHVILGDDFSLRDPAVPEKLLTTVNDIFKAKEQNGIIEPLDFGVKFFSAPNFDKTRYNMDEEFAKLVVQKGDIEANWRAWLKEKEPQINEVLKELNEALAD